MNKTSILYDFDSLEPSEQRARHREHPADDVDERAVQVRLKQDFYARRAAAELRQVAEDIDVISRAAFTPKDAA